MGTDAAPWTANATRPVRCCTRFASLACRPRIRRSNAALLSLRTQREDGSWHVKSRAMKIQPYFESGFPYEHDQWISHAATAWATMALTATARDESPVRTATVR